MQSNNNTQTTEDTNKENEVFAHRFERDDLQNDQLEALKETYSLFGEELTAWLARLYDPEIGGFYYSDSARDCEGFLPDVEDTAFALADIVGPYKIFRDDADMLACLARYGKRDFDTRLIAFVRSLQDPEDGFFYHPQWGKRVTDVGLFRHFNNANRLLARYGAKPLYPTPETKNERGERPLPPYMKSKEALLTWLNSFPWTKDQTYHSASVVGEMADTLAEIGLVDTACDFFDALQMENGTFEEEASMMAVNGIMKVCKLYRAAKRPFRRLDKLLDTTLAVMKADEKPTLICSIANPWTVLVTLREMTTERIAHAKRENTVRAKEMLASAERDLALYTEKVESAFTEIVRKTTEKLRLFKKPDGAFSMLPETCGASAVGVEWSLSLPESDINGTNLAINSILLRFFSAIGKPAIPFASPAAREEFARILAEATPVKKRKCTSLDHTVSFRNAPLGSFRYDLAGTTSNGNCDSTVKEEGGKRFLSHHSKSGGASMIQFALPDVCNLRSCRAELTFRVHPPKSKDGGCAELHFGRGSYMLNLVIEEGMLRICESNTNAPHKNGGRGYVNRPLAGAFALGKWLTLTEELRYDEKGDALFLTSLRTETGDSLLIGESTLFYNPSLEENMLPVRFMTCCYLLIWRTADITVDVSRFSLSACDN